jgi:hypothetical protein
MHEGKLSAQVAKIDEDDEGTIFGPEIALALGDEDDPCSIGEALAGPEADHWAKVMKTEITQLECLHTWEIVNPPPGANIINSGFVFHQKCDVKGNIASHKARFIGKGYSQVYRVDYYETFSPSVKMSSQQVVLSHAVKEDWEVPQVDIKGAYLNTKLPEKIYMKLLHNYLKLEEKGKVCCPLKGLYGVKQAGCKWYKELSRTFIKLGLT